MQGLSYLFWCRRHSKMVWLVLQRVFHSRILAVLHDETLYPEFRPGRFMKDGRINPECACWGYGMRCVVLFLYPLAECVVLRCCVRPGRCYNGHFCNIDRGCVLCLCV